MPPPMGAGSGRIVKSFVLPNGLVMVKSGDGYDVNTETGTIRVEAATDAEAVRIGSLKVLEAKSQKE